MRSDEQLLPSAAGEPALAAGAPGRAGWTAAEIGYEDPLGWWQQQGLAQLRRAVAEQGFAMAYVAVIEALAYRFGVPLVARTRAVFRTGAGTVLKVPHTADGALANTEEIAASRAEVFPVPITPTRALSPARLRELAGEHLDVEGLIVAEAAEVAVVLVADYGLFPDWVADVDCGQVGYLPDGRLVAYDL